MDFPILFKITPEPFGLDISDGALKIVKIGRRGDDIYLENFGERDIPQGLIEDGVIQSEEKLASLIREAVLGLKMGALATRFVACSLPEQKTYLRVLQLPSLKDSEIQEAIQWEIEANIPLALNDAYFSWEVTPSAKKQSHHLDVLVSVAPRTLVDSYTAVLLKAGLKPFSFEPESVALVRSLVRGQGAEKPVLIVDLGKTNTSFIVYAGRGIRFTSSIKISGDMMTKNIARALNVDEKAAEQQKREVGLNREKDGRIFDAITPLLTDLTEQISAYIQFYNEHASHVHSSEFRIAKILLSGGGASMQGFEKYLSMALKIEVVRANPWANVFKVPLRKVPELSYEDSIRYATAIGLALAKHSTL